MAKRYWLFKSEPSVFSITDLESAPKKSTSWDGVRNFQARNFLRHEIKQGDQVFFYHSNADPPAIVGIAEVIREGYPDETAFAAKDAHYDPKSDRHNPTWYTVDIKHVETFAKAITLAELRQVSGLRNMVLLQKGSRLSVQPVRPEEWELVIKLAKQK